MNINKIGGLSNNYPSGNYNKTQKENQAYGDSVNISETAKNRISLQKVLELVKNTTNVRQDKIEAAKNRLSEYFTEGNINSEVTEKIAKKIIEDMKQGLL